MRITIIINESDGGTLERIRAQVAALREAGEEVFPRLTFEQGDATWMAREACERGCDLLIAAGGDGTVNEAVNGIHGWITEGGGHPRQAPALAILPLGTGNDLASALGISPEVEEAMATALVSALSDRPVRSDVAMTGEITLRGRVLPIGGLKEKLLAALRGGIKTVLIPEENAKDLADIPDNVKNELNIIPVSLMDEVLSHALVRQPEPIEWEEEAEPLPKPIEDGEAPGLTAH